MRGLLTASRLACYRRCPREHHYRYELGLRTKASAAQALGTLVHLGLEAWWGVSKAPDLSGLTALESSLFVMGGQGADPYDLARAQALLIGYDARWADEPYEVLGVEQEFRAPLPYDGPLDPAAPWVYGGAETRPPWTMGGKLDALVRDQRGDIYVVEHKTTSEDASPGSAYWARLRLDGQVSLYHLGAAALGYEVAGVLYDVLVKPALKPERATPEAARKWTKARTVKCPACRGPLPGCATCGGTGKLEVEPPRLYAGQRDKDEAPEDYRARLVQELASDPDRYFRRAVVVRLDRERRQHLQELRAWAQRMGADGEAPTNPDACTRYGSVCPFLGLCTGERTESDYERVSWPHPELTEDKDGL